MHLAARQQGPPGGGGPKTSTIVVLVVVICCLIVGIIVAVWLFRRHSKAQANGEKASWRKSIQSITSTFSRSGQVRPDVHGMSDVANANGVDRNTSVRSTMTLPAYSPIPRENEGVIGREGERAGMDTVVEFPETNDEEEGRREQEMETLYQIRLARRTEAAARESRRQRRREARQRGDLGALETIRLESQRARRARELSGSQALITEHESNPRSRRVSSVSYANLGVARHDGTRVRANSAESQLPLLDASGAMDLSDPVRPWVTRDSSSHRRAQSSLSNLSMTSYGSEDDSGWSDGESSLETVSLHPGRSRGQSQSRPGSRPQTATRPVSSLHSDSRLSLVSSRSHRRDSFSLTADGEATTAAPEYEDIVLAPPPYAEPVHTSTTNSDNLQPLAPTGTSLTGSPSLPAITRLPSIRITMD